MASRPPLSDCSVLTGAFPVYHEMCNRNVKEGLPPSLHSKKFTPEFLDCFDVIIIMHVPEWIVANWEVLRGRNVIWRTIGQSTPNVEKQIEPYRKEGLKVVRYSPKEQEIPFYAGEDELIRFGKYPSDFKMWEGNLEQVITIGQSMKKRSWWCNYDLFRQVTKDFPTKLYGNDNDDEDEAIRGGQIPNYAQLIDVLSQNSVYFYTGTRPASYTLNFMEAAFAGTPMVSVSHQSVLFEGKDYFEVPDLLEKYRAGFFSDDPDQLKDNISLLLYDRCLAESVSNKLRFMAAELFDANKIRKTWERFLASL